MQSHIYLVWCAFILAASAFTMLATGNTNATRLSAGWEDYRSRLGSACEIWRGATATDNVERTPVTLAHCLNARDAVDPDER